MRDLALLIFQTLDGVMQAPSVPEEDFSGGFTQGGWARDHWEEVMEQVGREAMSDTHDLLLGRNTYNSFAASFANAEPDNPAAARLNPATKYVVTSGHDELTWHNSVKLSTTNIAAEIRKLKQQAGPLLQVHGSWQLVQTLLANALVDEIRLWTFPMVVGTGKRLFADGTIPTKFQLTKFATTPSGVVMQFYRPFADAAA